MVFSIRIDIDILIDVLVDDDLNFLKMNALPWARVVELWNKTAGQRGCEELMVDYLRHYPALRTPYGYKLVSCYFNICTFPRMFLYHT